MIRWLVALLCTAPVAAAAKAFLARDIIGRQAARHSSVRRLDEDGDNEEDDYEFLTQYDHVYMGCNPDAEVVNENGRYVKGGVIVRLCPSEAGACSDDGEVCSDEYGELVVDVQTYMELYLDQMIEQEKENNNNDDDDEQDYDIEEFSSCSLLEVDDERDGYDYYIGPLCSEEGTLQLSIFKVQQDENGDEDAADNICVAENASSDVTYQDVMGEKLPFNEPYLESDQCTSYSCQREEEENDNNDDDAEEDEEENEPTRFCKEMYDQAAFVCDGSNEKEYPEGEGCEAIQKLMKSGSGGGGEHHNPVIYVVLLIVAVIVVVAIFGFLPDKRKKSATQETLLDDEEENNNKKPTLA